MTAKLNNICTLSYEMDYYFTVCIQLQNKSEDAKYLNLAN